MNKRIKNKERENSSRREKNVIWEWSLKMLFVYWNQL